MRPIFKTPFFTGFEMLELICERTKKYSINYGLLIFWIVGMDVVCSNKMKREACRVRKKMKKESHKKGVGKIVK